MPDPLLSIITVTKNNAAGLKMTAKSIANQQSMPNFEWIIIDGASTDHTAEIVDTYKTENTIFVSEPDNGIYDAINKGIDRATGRYLWFLNAGDCISDAYVMRDIAREIQNNLAPDFIFADARENGMIKRAHGGKAYEWGQITHHQAMLYRRGLLGDLHYDTQYKVSADYAFTLSILAKSNKNHYMKRILCDFETGGYSQQNAVLGRQENYLIRQELLGMNAFKNGFILQLNKTTFFIKNAFPKLYRKARSSSR